MCQGKGTPTPTSQEVSDILSWLVWGHRDIRGYANSWPIAKKHDALTSWHLCRRVIHIETAFISLI